tara:strand:- start:3193 stop:3573 length:381 start_codon:yes stop_codon:yes gene_type:complete
MLCDYENILPNEILPALLKSQGWLYRDSKQYKDYTLMKPDFYPVGYVLAVSMKAVIVCDGETLIEYKDKLYTDVEDMISEYGIDVISTFHSWKFLVEREWVVKKNGEYVHSFSSCYQIGKRSKLRC